LEISSVVKNIMMNWLRMHRNGTFTFPCESVRLIDAHIEINSGEK